jgi:hypothetical protein
MAQAHSCHDGSIQPGRTVSCPRCHPKRKPSPTSGMTRPRAKLTAKLLRRHPVCQCCEQAPSTVLHHIAAVSERPDLILDEANALMLCKPCHRLAKNRSATLRELQPLADVAGLRRMQRGR